MQYAIDHGADMVEFDVQVILHNSIFYVWTRKLIQKTNVAAVSRRAALCLPRVSPLRTHQSQAGPWCNGWRPGQGIFWVFKVIFQRPLKDLSLAELQGLKSHHPSEKVAGVKVSSGSMIDVILPFWDKLINLYSIHNVGPSTDIWGRRREGGTWFFSFFGVCVDIPQCLLWFQHRGAS